MTVAWMGLAMMWNDSRRLHGGFAQEKNCYARFGGQSLENNCRPAQPRDFFRSLFSIPHGARTDKYISVFRAVPLESQLDMCDKKFLIRSMCDGKGGESKMGKKFVSLAAITLFAFTLTFVGCGKKEEPAPPPPPPAPAAPAPEPAAPPEPAKDAAPAPDKGMEKKEDAKTK